MKPQTRPRSYSFGPTHGYASQEIGWLVAALQEVTERHMDMLLRLPEGVADARLGSAPSTIMQITSHLGWGDAYWLGALRGQPIHTPDILDRDQHEPPTPFSRRDLVAACRDVRDAGCEYLRAVADPHRPQLWKGDGQLTAHGVLMHLIWHWTYHNGQCGEIALAEGYVHPWSFEKNVGRIGLEDDD